MKHTEGTFSGSRGLSIYYQYWEPNKTPRALLLVVHGAGEHCNRYQALAQYFTARGYVVAALAQAAGLEVDQCLLGTCTNGRLSDLEIAAKILRGKRVHPRVRLLVLPASRDVLRTAIATGVLDRS